MEHKKALDTLTDEIIAALQKHKGLVYAAARRVE